MSGRGLQIGTWDKEEEYVADSHISGRGQMRSLTWVQLQSPMAVITPGHCLCKRVLWKHPTVCVCAGEEKGEARRSYADLAQESDTWRRSTRPCLRSWSDRLSVSAQMDCELCDGLEILSEEPPTVRGPGRGP